MSFTTVRQVLESVEHVINDANADFTATFQFVCEPEGTYRLVIRDGRCQLADGSGDATSTVIAAAEDAVLIFGGKTDAMKAFMEGRMKIEGDLMAMTVLSQFTPGGTKSTSGPSTDQRVPYLTPESSPSFESWRTRAATSSRGRNLRQVADERGIFVGAALKRPDDVSATTIVPRECSQVGAENAFKWHAVAQHVGEYDFELTDRFADYAAEHNLRLRGHALIWGRAGRPKNLESVVRAASDPKAAMRSLMRNHIATMLDRYRGKVHAWDVVNEPMAYGGVGLDPNVFVETIGETYVAEAFHMARDADADVELVLNEQVSASQYDDVGGEQFFQFAKQLIDDGVPIDGIGLQGHHLMGVPSRQAVYDYLRRIEDLGVFIEITEMDMRIGLFAGHDDPLGAQAEAYHMYAELIASVPAVRGVLLWGAADVDSWLDHFPPFDAGAPNQPLLFDRAHDPKPAYYGFLHGLASTS